MTEQDVTNRRIRNRRYWRRHKHVMKDRKEYFANYYQANRKKKLAAAKARYQYNPKSLQERAEAARRRQDGLNNGNSAM